MEPITLILTALTIGAATIAKGALTEMGKEAYQNLKKSIQNKLAGNKEAELVLEKYEEKPTVWETPLKDMLITAGIDKDKEIIQTAQNLLSIIDPQQAAVGKYNLQITGEVNGIVQGDNAQVTMHFTDKSPKK